MRIAAHRWIWERKKYESCSLPEKAITYTENLKDVIQCANCEKHIKAGDTYTSKEIHDLYGFGYLVCPKCYDLELEREKQYKKVDL